METKQNVSYQLRGVQASSRLQLAVISLLNILNMGGNTSVSPDAVLRRIFGNETHGNVERRATLIQTTESAIP